VYLDNALIALPDLPARIDALAAQSGGAVVLCVGMPDKDVPQVGVTAVQRRINLLAIEQNAWVLAGRDRRWMVVESRTEVDWAVRQGHTIVWAPSKLVLDTPDAPIQHAANGPALALWLAESLAARALVMPAGVSLSAGSRVPVETWPA
jgi:dihydroneopterin aldolase